MQIKLEEVIEAIEKTDANTQYYYSIPEERIYIPDEEEDRKKLIPLPSHKQIDDYGTMRSFISRLEDEEAAGWLEEAIKGSGAFRRFRSTLERFGLSEQWLDYLETAHENTAIDWCEYYGIEYLEDDPFYTEKKEEGLPPKKSEPKHNYRFITIDQDNLYSLAYLTVEFRKVLASLKNQESRTDVDDAVEELKYYVRREYPVFAISDNGRYIAYAVCRIEDDVVWLESIYVRKEYRGKGIGKMLLEKAEEIAKEHGNDTLYQYVHPNNDRMLNFLKKNGYDVLNLIEIRKAYPQEEPKEEYTIGDHCYRY